MDEQQQANGEQGHAGASGWRVNGAPVTAGVHGPEQAWSSAGAALEPSAEPLALLANHGGGDARHRQPYTPGLDDDTPAGGVPAVEPPLWREAARHSRGAGSVYSSHYPDYPPAPVPEPAAYEPPTVPAEPYAPPPVPPPPQPPPPPAVPPPPSAPPGATAELPTPVIPMAPRSAPPAPRSAPPMPVESASLPQRVPAEPDVPVRHQPDPGFPIEPARERERWTAPELAWIADQLRRDDVPGERPPETLDVDAVVAAVREVSGVESATVRANPTGIHTLRLDLADDADPGQVSSTVARLLLERMGLSAAPQHVPHARVSEETTTPLAPEETTAPLAPPPTPMPEPAWPAPAAEGSWDYEPPQPELDPLADGPLTTPPEERPEVVSRPIHTSQPGPRVVIDQVQVSTFGLEAVVEVQLTAGDRSATGEAAGPAVDSYVTRLAAVAAAKAIDELLRGGALDRAGEMGGGPSRCFVEHTGVVSFGNTEVAVAVVLLVCGGWVEKLTGSALVDTDSRQAVVRATLGAVNRRLEALLD